MKKTNNGLVEYAKGQVGRPYWYGTYGQIGSESLYNAKKKQYPSFYTDNNYKSQYGKKVHDCVGIIKGYLWSDSIDGIPKYNSAQDKSAKGMYAASSEKGNMTTFPGINGTLVYKGNPIHHVGVYCTDGNVYEAKGHAWGVVKTPFVKSQWNYWSQCPYTEKDTTYSAPEEKETTASCTYYKKYTGNSVSIADALRSIGEDGSYTNRAKIADINGIINYSGTAQQNSNMLNLLKQGKLIKTPGTTSSSSSVSYYPRYSGDSYSIADALRSVGTDGSYNHRCIIASVNNIEGYQGTAQQNSYMLKLLKNGTLIKE